MKIFVLIKPVLDRNADIEPDELELSEFDDDEIVINQYDYHALEAAIALKEASQVEHITAISVTCEEATHVLQEAMAMGADETLLIKTEDLETRDEIIIAEILSAAIKEKGIPDLIFCGMTSFDLGSGAVPAMLAEFLELPHASYAEKFEFEENRVKIDKTIEGGYRSVRLSLPAVLSVANTANKPRYISVGRIMKARKNPVPSMELDDIDVDDLESTIKVLETSAPPERPECVIFEGTGAVEELFERLKQDGINLEEIGK